MIVIMMQGIHFIVSSVSLLVSMNLINTCRQDKKEK